MKINKMSHEKFSKLDYLSVKVVPVEGKPKVKYITTSWIDGKLYGFRRLEKGRLGMEEINKEKICEGIKKGQKNWVNGENLDEIKFPAFCSFVDTKNKQKFYGMINYYKDAKQYRLYWIEQTQYNFIDDCTSLGNLINSHDIHILKGKFILFEEANE